MRELVADGHDVVVETAAGVGSAIGDEDFAAAGASIVADADAVFAVADMIVKVKEPQPQEYERFREGQVLFTYLHLAADEGLTRFLAERTRAERRLRDRADARRPAAAARPRCRRSPAGWRRRKAPPCWSVPTAAAAS